MLLRLRQPGPYNPMVTNISNYLVVLVMGLVAAIFYHVHCKRSRFFRDRQPCLLVSNHVTFIDPPLVGMCVRGHLTYFARRSLWRVPVINLILNLVGAIPVDRSKPALVTFKDTIASLDSGRSVLLFPEGTRSSDGRIGRLRGGFALMARRANVPVVPVYLHNMHRAWPRDKRLPRCFVKVTVFIGRPVRAPQHLDPKQQDVWLSGYVERWLRTMEKKMTGAA